MQLAFKEWATIVEALGRGERILSFRKRGLQEAAALGLKLNRLRAALAGASALA